MNLLERVAAKQARLLGGGTVEKKSFAQPPFWSMESAFGGGWSSPDRERIENDFIGYVRGAYKSNGIVYACIAARQEIFGQVRFGWREFRNFRPGDLFGNAELGLLERPWLNATTIDLLTRMEVVASLAGNYYATVTDDAGRLGNAATGPGRRIVDLRPDWVSIVIVSPTDDPWDPRARIGGYLYEPMGGAGSGPSARSWILMPGEVCQFAPKPDPEMRFRGMSWLTPILREIQADKAATKHKERFFANGAQLGVIVRFDKEVGVDALDAFKERFNAAHKGEANAYSTLFLGGGADVTVASADMQQVDFKGLAGGGESRIASVAGIHPTIAGFSEGLQGSSLNTGNFGAARRLVADKTLRHLWGVASSSLQTLVTPPSSTASLWYDTSDVAFLREDATDSAAIVKEQMLSIESGVRGGYDPASVVTAVQTGDLTVLKHTGLYSVQLQAPGTTAQPPVLQEQLPVAAEDQ